MPNNIEGFDEVGSMEFIERETIRPINKRKQHKHVQRQYRLCKHGLQNAIEILNNETTRASEGGGKGISLLEANICRCRHARLASRFWSNCRILQDQHKTQTQKNTNQTLYSRDWRFFTLEIFVDELAGFRGVRLARRSPWRACRACLVELRRRRSGDLGRR